MISYDNLDEELKQEIQACQLDTSKTLERCGTGCIKVNEVTYVLPCSHTEILVDNQYCMQKCPKEFIEKNYGCEKNKAFTLEVFSDQATCEKMTGKECEGYKKNAIFTSKCGQYFEKVFKTICLPQCPEGYIDNGAICEKRSSRYERTPFIFNFQDLFN